MIGHTAAWKVRTLEQGQYNVLQAFLSLRLHLTATIRRHQLEIAIRRVNDALGAGLRLVRRDVVLPDTSGDDVLPIVATADKKYILERGRIATNGRAGLFDELRAAYHLEQQTIHSTVVAEVVKRYIRRRLMAFPIREHGGVYFVSSGREDELFALRDFLTENDMGRITSFRVTGEAGEIEVLTEEINHLITSRTEKLREAIGEADLSDEKKRRRLMKKVHALRADLDEMKQLFGFARGEIAERDDEARTLLQETLRRAAPPTLPLAA